MRKWLLLGGLVILVVSLYFLTYVRGFVWMVSKVTKIPIVPRVEKSEVRQLSSNSVRAQFGGWSKEGWLRTTMVGPDGSPEEIDWSLVKSVTVECIVDAFKAPDGTIVRRSNMLIVYKDGVKPARVAGRGIEWLRANAKNGSVLMVFGDRNTNQAEVVYLFKDKCD